MYKIFLEPHVNEITVNSIIRVDTEDLSTVTELNDFNYTIVDQFENTYYIIPTSRKAVIKPKCKLVKNTRRTTDFDYTAKEYINNKNTTWDVVVTCHVNDLNNIINLLDSTVSVTNCPDEELEGDTVTYIDSIVLNDYEYREEAQEAYRDFKTLLKGM